MVRTQISLEPEEISWLRRQAKRRGTSLAGVISKLIRAAEHGRGRLVSHKKTAPPRQLSQIAERFRFVGCINARVTRSQRKLIFTAKATCGERDLFCRFRRLLCACSDVTAGIPRPSHDSASCSTLVTTRLVVIESVLLLSKGSHPFRRDTGTAIKAIARSRGARI